MNDDRAFFLGAQDPLEGDGMMLGSVAAHDEKRIGVFQIDPVIGHCPASKRLSQSRYSRAMSGAGLMVDMDDTQTPDHLMGGRAFFVVGMGCADKKHGIQAVDCLSFVVLKNQVCITNLLDTGGDLFECPFPGFFLPFGTARRPVHGFFQAVLVAGHGEHGCSLGAQRTFIDGILGVSLCADQFAVPDMGDDMAAYGTKRTYGDNFFGSLDFQGGGIRLNRLDIDTQLQEGQAQNARPGHLQEFSPVAIHACLLLVEQVENDNVNKQLMFP